MQKFLLRLNIVVLFYNSVPVLKTTCVFITFKQNLLKMRRKCLKEIFNEPRRLTIWTKCGKTMCSEKTENILKIYGKNILINISKSLVMVHLLGSPNQLNH